LALSDRNVSEVCEDASFERLQKLHGSFVFAKFKKEHPKNKMTIKWVVGSFTSMETSIEDTLFINVNESISRVHTIPTKDILYIYSIEEMEESIRIPPKDLENGTERGQNNDS